MFIISRFLMGELALFQPAALALANSMVRITAGLFSFETQGFCAVILASGFVIFLLILIVYMMRRQNWIRAGQRIQN